MLKKGLRNKKASGHLEMIFAFVFFVSFVFFLLMTISPYDEDVLPDSILRGLVDSFEKQSSTNLTSFFLKVNYTNQVIASNCFYISLSQQYFNYPLQDVNSRAVNALTEIPSASQWTFVPAAGSGTLRLSKDIENYQIMLSPEFTATALPGCTSTIPQDHFEIGNLLEREVISYSELVNMKNDYLSDYSDLRDQLGVPQVYDFSIISNDLPEINMEKNTTASVDVYPQNYIFEVLKSDGTIINAKFVIGVW